MREDARTARQLIMDLWEALEKTPLPAGRTSQRIPVAQDETVTVLAVRMMPGAELAAHYHEKHAEVEYVVRGQGMLLVEGKRLPFGAGSLHFNPPGKVHGAQNTGDEPLIVLVVFTPAMKEEDRHFVQ